MHFIKTTVALASAVIVGWKINLVLLKIIIQQIFKMPPPRVPPPASGVCGAGCYVTGEGSPLEYYIGCYLARTPGSVYNN